MDFAKEGLEPATLDRWRFVNDQKPKTDTIISQDHAGRTLYQSWDAVTGKVEGDYDGAVMRTAAIAPLTKPFRAILCTGMQRAIIEP